ncbi:unnamed protein product [Alternaria alternata]
MTCSCGVPTAATPWTREVRILRVRTEDRDRVDPYLRRVNIHKYSKQGEAKHFDMENDSARGWAMVGVVQAKSAIRVYKEGRTTGKTFGALTAVRIDMSIAYKSFIGIPIKMTPTEDLKLDSLGITLEELMARDKYRWVGLVEWIAESEPSTDKGDSGALVYAIEDSQTVPLGIHIGRSL